MNGLGLLDVKALGVSGNADDMHSRLETLRPVYDEAVRRVNGEDPIWEEKKNFLTQKMFGLIKGFSGDDTSTKAVLIIGQSQAIAAELDAPRMLILQFETLRDHYNSVVGRST